MTGSWFRSSASSGTGNGLHHHHHHGDPSKISMKEAVKALYPSKSYGSTSSYDPISDATESRGRNRTRFSPLLLEHGEQHIQDWAVIAYTTPGKANAFLAASSPRSGGGSSSNNPHAAANATQWAEQSNIVSKSTSSLSPKANRKSFRRRNQKHKQQKVDKESHPTVHMTNIEGRLHLCSRSIIFEPADAAKPILRCPFTKMETPPKEFPSTSAAATGNYEPMCVEFLALKHVCCKINNKIGPVEGIATPTLFRFTFLHSKPSSLVELCNKLFAILHMESSSKSSNTMSKANGKEMKDLLRPMLERPFDPTNMVDVRERPLLASNLKCHLIQPLQQRPGCLVITHERIYFQPAQGVLSESTSCRAVHWNQEHVVATARRYRGLQDSALEIFLQDGQSTLFELRNKHEREQVLRLLPTVPCHTDRDFVMQASQEWQKRKISNYDYLLLLNSAASRTVHDLSRYPVFPWVIADYSSDKLDLDNPQTYRDLTKPVGALNEERLNYFRQRFDSMQDMEDPFLYGTHYSAAGYILYYLVRSMPEHMLCLQNGKFDAPDRMFHSVDNCFSSVLTNHADVKELIPEFYNPHNDFDFLINAKSLQLGATQNGERVDDVILPPWAKSPRDFLKKNRKALESEICTSMLPRWVDLIFGSKSRGDAAREANNLFHKSAYMGPVDWSNMSSDEERFQAELQATEFGIVPDQLFVGPHPLRHETVDDSFIHTELGRTMSVAGEDGKGDAWELLDAPSHEDSHLDTAIFDQARSATEVEVNPAEVAPQGHVSSSSRTSHNAPSKNKKKSTISGQAQGLRVSTGRPNLPLSGTSDGQQAAGAGAFSDMSIQPSLSNLSATSVLNGSVSIQRTDTAVTTSAASSDWDMKIIERSRLHEEAISGCFLHQETASTNKPTLTTTSLDGGLKVHHVSTGVVDSSKDQASKGISGTLSRFSYLSMARTQVTSSTQTKLIEFRSHTSRDPLACLAQTNDGQGGQVAFAGGHDDVVLAYGINSACAVASVYSHRDAVTGLDLVPRDPTRPATKLWLEHSTHIMVSGSWDATVKVWSVTVSTGETVSINREPLAELFDADSSIVSVSAISLADGSIVVASGCADGSFCAWNLHCDGVRVVIHKEPARRGSGPCSVVKWTNINGKMQLFTGFSTGKVASFELAEGTIRRIAAVSVGVAVQCLVHSEGILLIGCADGGLRLIQVRDDGSFATNPTLWGAVNDKSAPGITSISLAYIANFLEGSTKCICCTGAEDGSVALFELKKVSR